MKSQPFKAQLFRRVAPQARCLLQLFCGFAVFLGSCLFLTVVQAATRDRNGQNSASGGVLGGYIHGQATATKGLFVEGYWNDLSKLNTLNPQIKGFAHETAGLFWQAPQSSAASDGYWSGIGLERRRTFGYAGGQNALVLTSLGKKKTIALP